MKTLATAHLVQFSFWDYESFELRPGGTGVVGPNGVGKTSLIDAVQIAMLGAHGLHRHFNAQSAHKDARTLRSYALGTVRSGEGEQSVLTRKRDEALSYISLVFRGSDPTDVVSAGLCIHATLTEERVMGWYVLPGVELELEHHLEDLRTEGKAPIDWSVFVQQCRMLARASGRTPSFPNAPETYVQELLHNIQQGVDARKYMRAFGHSINLKAVSSVGEFLRGYLVDAVPIDKRGTLQHIKTLRALSRQIEEVSNQESRLADIEKLYDRHLNQRRQRSVALATRRQLEFESVDEQLGALDVKLSEWHEKLHQAEGALPHLEAKQKMLRSHHEAMLLQLNADPEHKQPAQLQHVRALIEQRVTQARKDVERLQLHVRVALADTADAVRADEPTLSSLLNRSRAAWDALAAQGETATAARLATTLDQIGQGRLRLTHLLKAARESNRLAENSLAAVRARVQALNQGRRLVDDNVARAGALLDQAGIGYEPVATSVRVTDSRWQGPIETFLGPHRLALLVQAGGEDAAVELIRQHRVNDVTIVQPAHLTDDIGRVVASDSVAALLAGSNPIALAYLRRILGRMKQVSSAEALRREARAMTNDYMLSANGGTKRLRPLDQAAWVLGVQLSNADRVSAEEGQRQASLTLRAISTTLAQLEAADRAADRALTEVPPAVHAEAATQLQVAQQELAAAPNPEAEPVSERLQALRNGVETARQESAEADQACNDVRGALREAQSAIDILTPQRATLTAHLKSADEAHREALSDPDCDADLLPLAYEKLAEDVKALGSIQALSKHDQRVRQLDGQTQASAAQSRDAFIEFISEYSIGLVDERSDWRRAHSWVREYGRKLRDSTLVEHRQDAEAARVAAEQSFRSDVKFKIREAIFKVRQEIRDLNSILKTAPAFTNGEQYQFVAAVSPAHRALHDYVVSEDEGRDLFGQRDGGYDLVGLLNAVESGQDKGNNPLEDYRLLFNFDLQILQDQKVVDLFSQRLGRGSNGEHRVPFYVIAGVALATAYRIRPNRERSGAAVMILDEAFHGLDAQNTFATSNFLKSLGLQLLMAGPDHDLGRLATVMDNYYDLSRFGTDVFAEHIVIKPAGRKLLTSDMPLLHPELFGDAEARVLAQRKAGNERRH